MSNLPTYAQTILSVPTQLTSSTSTSAPTQILAAQTNGCRVANILVASTDTSARDLNLYVAVGGTNYFLCTISIPAGAGTTNNIPTVDLLSALTGTSSLLPLQKDNNGNPILLIDASTTLKILPGATITSTKNINLVVIGGAL